MGGGQANADLERALHLSHDMAAAADQGRLEVITELDAERLQLLKSFRTGNGRIEAIDRLLLDEIARENDRAIGLLEHHRRIKGREMDMAAIGRRAVNAYATTRLSR